MGERERRSATSELPKNHILSHVGLDMEHFARREKEIGKCFRACNSPCLRCITLYENRKLFIFSLSLPQVQCIRQVELQIYKVLNFIHTREEKQNVVVVVVGAEEEIILRRLQLSSKKSEPRAQEKKYFGFISALNWISICFMIDEEFPFNFLSSLEVERRRRSTYTKKI